MSLFLGSQSSSIDLCRLRDQYVPVSYYFDSCSFVVLSEVRNGYASCFVLFLQDGFGNYGSSVLHMPFRIICSSSLEKAMGNLTEVMLNL